MCKVMVYTILLFSFSLVAAQNNLSDIDGHVYRVIQIGNQTWMAENLRVTRYRDGTPIPQIDSADEWANTPGGAFCRLQKNSSEGLNGILYNWYAATDTHNIAPEGWHVPSDEEWKELEMHLGMSQNMASALGNRGSNEGSKLAGNAGLWRKGSLVSNATFSSTGFNALPEGYRSSFDGHYGIMNHSASFWTASNSNYWNAWYRQLDHSSPLVYRDDNSKNFGFSIRCVRD